MKTRVNLFFFSSAIIVLAIFFSTLLFLAQMHADAVKWSTTEQEQAIQTFWQMLYSKGNEIKVVNGTMMVGDYVVNGNFELPDKIKEIFGGTATIFVGDTRVSTNVLKEDGTRAVGTKLQGPAYEAIFKENRSYRGEAPIFGIPYFTAYDPIRDVNGKTIGVLYVGSKKSDFLSDYEHRKTEILAGTSIMGILLIALSLGLLRERSQNEIRLREMADQIRLITDSVPAAIAYIDASLNFQFANRRYHELFGGNLVDLIGKSVNEVLDKSLLAARQESFAQVLAGKELVFTSQIPQSSGESIYLQTTFIPHQINSGKVVGFFIQHHDITELTLTHEALRSSGEQYRSLFNTTGAITFVVEEDTTVSLVNDEFIRHSGWLREEVEGRISWTDFVTPESRERMLDYHKNRRFDPASAPQVYECDVTWKDGIQRSVLVHVNLIPATSQSIVSFHDISIHKKLEADLQNQLSFLQILIDTIPNPIFYKDRAGRYLGYNQAFQQMLGLSREQIIGKTTNDIAPQERAAHYQSMDEALFSNPGTQMYEYAIVDANGRHRDVIFYKGTFTDKDGLVAGLVGIIHDVTERKLSEDALAAAEKKFRCLVEQSLVGTYIIQDDCFTYVNPKMAEIFGYSQTELMSGMTHFDLEVENDRWLTAENIRKRITGEIQSINYEFNGLRKDGRVINVEVYGTITEYKGKPAIIGTLLDITASRLSQKALMESEERYRVVFENTGSAMIISENDTIISLANMEFAALTGFSIEEIVGKKSWADFIVPSDREKMLAYHHLRRFDPKAAPACCEFRIVDKTGTVKDIMLTEAMFPGADKSIQSYLNITEQKQSQRLLAGEKQVMEMVVSGIPLPDVLTKICLNIEEQTSGGLCSVLLLDDDRHHLRHAAAPSLPEAYSRAIDGTRIGPGIGSCGTAAFTGQQVIVSDIATDPLWAKYRKIPLSFGLQACWSQPIASSSGEILGTFAVYYNAPRLPSLEEQLLVERTSHLASIVIERKKATESLQQIQGRQQAMLDNIPDLVWLKDRDSRFVTVNKAFADCCGTTPDELAGKTDLDVWPPDLAEKYRRDDEHVMNSGEQTRMEELLATHNGVRHWIETIKMPIYDGQGELIGTTGIARDIRDRKLADEALRESEDRFHRIFTQNDDAVVLFKMDTMEIIDVNPAALALFDYKRTELLDQKAFILIADKDFEALIDAIPRNNQSEAFQLDQAYGIRKDGKKITIVIRCKVLLLREEYVIHCSIRDITDKIRLEEEVRNTQAKLIHTNKMTSIGMLASSVAHEINNPNNCISVNAAMLSDVWKDAEPLLEAIHADQGEFNLRGIPFTKMQEFAPRLLDGIKEGSRRITTIVQNMRDYVRENKEGIHGSIDINLLLQNAMSILWHHIHIHTEKLHTEFGERLPLVRGNGQQLEQVFVNLITNALQALPDKKSGIYITTSVEDDKNVIIRIRDEGKGMDAATLARLTEPFFTTRTEDGGTGLGLYISASIIKDHGGTLKFQSEPGKGTTARITLAVAQ